MKDFTEYQVEVLEKTTIDCIDVTRLMGDYHDGDLPKTLHGRLHAHIKNCPICSEMFCGYSFVVKLAGELKGDSSMPIAVKSRLREKLTQELGVDLTLDNSQSQLSKS